MSPAPLFVSTPEKLWKDFCTFARAQLVSGDIDPTYPLLREVYKTERIDPNTALWRTLLYLAWYDLGTAVAAWDLWPTPRTLTQDDVLKLPRLSTGIERRGFRGVKGAAKAAAFVTAVFERSNDGRLLAWVIASGSWDAVRREMESCPGAGPWASYKWADLLKHTHSMPITASDIGVGGGSETAGPIPGMVTLTGLDWRTCATDVSAQQALLHRAVDDGVPFNGLDQLETALCDFNSLTKGGYYVGHDIDLQMEQLVGLGALFWEARARCFPGQYLGELMSWFGVRKPLKRTYIESGRVLT